jgi:SWIM zinc finger
MTQRELSLTLAVLRAATDPGRFGHGREYVDSVGSMTVRGRKATAIVDLTEAYEVSLDWSAPTLEGTCTCPDFAEGGFCKHLVAFGLALLGRARIVDLPDEPTAAVDEYLDQLGREELIELIGRLAECDPRAADLLRAEAAAARRGDAVDADALAREGTAALSGPRFVDYRASYGVALEAEDLLDRLERLLAAGAADAVAKALLRATKRLRQILLHADDSSGVIGSAGQRAVELYARACREGNPNPVPLAKWLVKFRRDSPGWPAVELSMFIDAFDERALAEYRQAVDRWSADTAAVEDFNRYEVFAALLELADHDGDIDRAIELLSSDSVHAAYGSIICRLLTAGRRLEAVDWLDRAVAAGRISAIAYGSRNDYFVTPDQAVELYVSAGRSEDALAVLQAAFLARVGPESWHALLEFADAHGRREEMRRWAVERSEEQAGRAHGSGADLISIYLADGLLEEAWSAAERFGAGSAWKTLADASARSRPREAAELYRAQIDAKLLHANTRVYPEVARMLPAMRSLSEAAGDLNRFEEYLADVRSRYARRSSLMGALQAQRL